MVDQQDQSPSYARRQALRQADAATLKSLNVLDTNPLTKYTCLANRLLDAFQCAVDDRNLDEAYVFGLRFSTFSLQVLPKHIEWNKNLKEKRRNQQQVDKVLSMMEILKQRMDVEEMVLRQQQQQKLAKEKEEAKKREEQQRQLQEQKHKQLEMERQQERIRRKEELEEQHKQQKQKPELKMETLKEKNDTRVSVEKSAMTKLLAMEKKISEPKIPCNTTSENQSVEEKKEQEQENETTTTTTTIVPSDAKQKTSRPLSMRKIGRSKKVEIEGDTTNKAKKSHLRKQQESRQTKPKIKQLTPSSSVPSSQSQHAEVAKTYGASPNKFVSQTKTSATAIKNLSHSQANISHVPDKNISKGEPVIGPTANQSIGSVNQPLRLRAEPRSEEEKVIIRLQAAIESQEKRLDDIDNVHIPALLEKAKAYLALDKEAEGSSNNGKAKSDGTVTVSSNRKAALTCMAHKKRLEKESDTIKAAIFNMETQQFMLENILEDRHVKKAMDDAAKAMEALHQAVGGDPSLVATDTADMSPSITPSPSVHVEDLDDEDLMAELEEWLAPEHSKKPRASTSSTRRQSSEQLEVLIKEAEAQQQDDDEISILTLPSIPKSPLESRVPTKKSKNLVPAVF